MKRHHHGFTLIELMAVVAVMSIIAAAVVLRVGSPMRAHQMKGIIEEIGAFDRLTRMETLEQDRSLRVLIDLDRGEFSRRRSGEEEDLSGTTLQLPASFRIARVRLADHEAEIGEITLEFGRRGVSPTYGILIEGPGRVGKWILVCGLTGEVVEISDEKEVENVLEALRGRDDPY